MSAPSAFNAALSAISKMQVDAINKACRIALEDGEAKVHSNVLAVLSRLEALLLLPTISSGPSKADPIKITAAVASFCVIDTFVNAKKQQGIVLQSRNASYSEENLTETAKSLAEAFLSLLPNAISLIKLGKRTTGSSGGADSTVADSPPSPAQQQQYNLFIKQIEPFMRQWPSAIASEMLAQFKAPLVMKPLSAVSTSSADGVASAGADNSAAKQPPPSAITTNAQQSAQPAHAVPLRISTAEFKRRSSILSDVLQLLASLQSPQCPLPLHRREGHLHKLFALLRHGEGVVDTKANTKPSQSKQLGKNGNATIALPPPSDAGPIAAALFEALANADRVIRQDLGTYNEAALMNTMAMAVGGVNAGGGGGKRERTAADENAEKNGADGNGPDGAPSGDLSSPSFDNKKVLASLSPEALVAYYDSLRFANVTPVTLESDVQRYLPFTLHLPSASVPPAGPSGSGYSAPNTFMDVLRSVEQSIRDMRLRLLGDRAGLKARLNAHGISPSAIETVAPKAFRVPAGALGSGAASDAVATGGGAEGQYLTAQQRSDANSLEASVAALGAARAAPFSREGLLVFPRPEGTPMVIGESEAVVANTTHVQPLSAVMLRREALKAATNAGNTADSDSKLAIQRAWAPTCDEWLGARDMVALPVLRFK